MIRLFFAATISALAIVPLYFMVLALSGDMDNRLLAPMLLAALGVSTAAMFFVALPLHLLLLRIGRSQWLYYAGVGFVVPALATYTLKPFGDEGPAYWLFVQMGVMAMMGVAVALVFWRITLDKSGE